MLTVYNPAIVEGLNVFIANSGIYRVDIADIIGTLLLSMQSSVAAAGTFIAVGKIVVPAGLRGQPGLDGADGEKGDKGETGDTGPTGPTGPQGDPGEDFPTTNDFYYEPAGVDYSVPLDAAYHQINLTASVAQVVLPEVGKYLLSAVCNFGGVVGSSVGAFKLRNSTAALDVPGSTNSVTIAAADNTRVSVQCQAIYTTIAVNQTIQFQVLATNGSANSPVISWDTVSITAVRIE